MSAFEIEPLAESAPLMDDLSRRLCLQAEDGTPGCGYYHGAWQYLRALGLFKTVGGHAEFFVETMKELAPAGDSPRVMLAGSADYSMAALVCGVYAAAGAGLELTVVDRCPTPLEITRWYGERIGTQVSLVQRDLLDAAAESAFDVIVTSSLLGNIAVPDRGRFFEGMHRQLRPGGRVVFVNRLHTEKADSKPVRFDDEGPQQLASEARHRALETQASFGFDPDRVEELALAFGQRRRLHPLPERTGLRITLEEAGFVLDRFEALEHGGSDVRGLTGPTVDVARTDIVVVARRPA